MPALRQKSSVGPLTARPPTKGLTATTGAGVSRSAARIPGTARIGPILAVPGIREALREAPAPVVAISPFVGGHAVKGPTDDFCRNAGIELSAQGIADSYGDVIDCVVADEPVDGVPALVTDTLMDSDGARGALAGKIMDFAGSLR